MGQSGRQDHRYLQLSASISGKEDAENKPCMVRDLMMKSTCPVYERKSHVGITVKPGARHRRSADMVGYGNVGSEKRKQKDKCSEVG